MATGTIQKTFVVGEYISDLDTPLSREPGIYIDKYPYTAANKSSTISPNNGFVITCVNYANLANATQICFDLTGIMGTRYAFQGTVSEWVKVQS